MEYQKHILKDYNEFLEVGKGWKWHDDLTIDTPLGKVYFCHGKTADVLEISTIYGYVMCSGSLS